MPRRKALVEIIKGPDSDENGAFAWIMDPDGNKVEPWEPMKNKKAWGFQVESSTNTSRGRGPAPR